ncbi:MAG: 23S rRNA pseudouridine(1911/1915/1917) synthase RluD [Betaproteobacteria bacterium]
MNEDLTENRDDYSASQTHHLTVPNEVGGRRLDQVLAELLPEHSRNRLQTWVKAGRVRVDGQVKDESKFKLSGGEELIVDAAPDEHEGSGKPEDIPLNIVFEDDVLLVIDKPAGLVVHPGSGNWSGTMMNALLHHAPRLAAVPRAGIVHRLDKDTSGLLVVAKTPEAQTDLVRQLQARTVRRQYVAIAIGRIEQNGKVEAPIGRHPVQRVKMAVTRSGKPAVTRYRVLENFAACTMLECSLETGRTHQIRVHMASLGHPLLGDPVYGRATPHLPPFGRQALHAARLGLIHPGSVEPMHWKSPLPADLLELLDRLRGA